MATLTTGEPILCVNAGSSSIKLTIRDPGHDQVLVTGAVEGIGELEGRLWFDDGSGAALLNEPGEIPDHDRAIELALSTLEQLDVPAVTAAGHRVVHGGLRLVEPTRINDGVLDELRSIVPLAPLHLPPQIACISAIATQAPGLPQVACFDTAFHRRMPELAQRVPMPEWTWTSGIRRFGFHGLSYEHVVDVIGPDSGRVVVAHLGSGASLAAIRDGAPVDTTMAFTPAAGVMMGTRDRRSGSRTARVPDAQAPDGCRRHRLFDQQ